MQFAAGVPNLFGTKDQIPEKVFPQIGGGNGGDVLGMIQAHYIYCAL